MREALNGKLADANFYRLMEHVKERGESLFIEVSHANMLYSISIHAEGIFVPINDDTEWFFDIVSETETGHQERITTYRAHSHLKDYEVVQKLNGFKQFICG